MENTIFVLIDQSEPGDIFAGWSMTLNGAQEMKKTQATSKEHADSIHILEMTPGCFFMDPDMVFDCIEKNEYGSDCIVQRPVYHP